MRRQETFCPQDYGFEWTEDWYRWDYKAGHKAALAARNLYAKRMREAGHAVRCGSLPNSLMTVGGIGSGHPQIEHVVTVYYVEVY